MACCAKAVPDSPRTRGLQRLDAASEEEKPSVKILLLGTAASGKTCLREQVARVLGVDEVHQRQLHAVTFFIERHLEEALTHVDASGIPDDILEPSAILSNIVEHHDQVQRLWDHLRPQLTRHDHPVVDRWESFVELMDSGCVKRLHAAHQAFEESKVRTMSEMLCPLDNLDFVRAVGTTRGSEEQEIPSLTSGLNLKLVTPGGQRSERKKWIHFFEDVRAVVFCVAATHYTKKLWEDDSTNALSESLRLWEEVCNSRWFALSTLMLCITHTDQLRSRRKDVLAEFPPVLPPVLRDICAAYVEGTPPITDWEGLKPDHAPADPSDPDAILEAIAATFSKVVPTNRRCGVHKVNVHDLASVQQFAMALKEVQREESTTGFGH